MLGIRSVVTAVDTDANLHDRNMRREHKYSITNGYYQASSIPVGPSMSNWRTVPLITYNRSTMGLAAISFQPLQSATQECIASKQTGLLTKKVRLRGENDSRRRCLNDDGIILHFTSECPEPQSVNLESRYQCYALDSDQLDSRPEALRRPGTTTEQPCLTATSLNPTSIPKYEYT
ncbi:uncharacterized protein BYT42DRAFT_548103 [Radiomyces spectabilis]|uniref:uncharacterized protein n=1 Tax=Radiomyces spectabilis TaxID=64574 RepID=UPI002220B60C|nr:uncharacterized protein BYT42DRAFT_548103 [Radiomyces spectabilis]KAI8373118.1 hypothetical protein BYT42DRAFT_548103 [Radiomyces spectabilis]